MAVREVQGTREIGYIGDLVPEIVAELSATELGSREDVENEIDFMFRTVREFWEWEPDQTMIACQALSARCSELYVQLQRVEGRFRQFKQVRTQQIVPLLDELDRQFKVASRLLEVRRQDIELLRGSR